MTTLYIDMDGVLVDLEKGYLNVTGVELKTSKSKTRWDIPLKVLGFWANLPTTKFCNMLFDARFIMQVEVLSAKQNKFERCDDDKKLWIYNHMPYIFSFVNIVNRSDKKLYAKSFDDTPNILVDDYKKNIDAWVEAGGIGILHTDAESTMKALKRLRAIK